MNFFPTVLAYIIMIPGVLDDKNICKVRVSLEIRVFMI